MRVLYDEVKHLRSFLNGILGSTFYNIFYVVVVVLDILCYALQTSENIPYQSVWYLEAIQLLFVAYYQLEVVIVYFAQGRKSLKDFWNYFGLTLVLLDLVGLAFPIILHKFGLSNFGIVPSIYILAVFRFIRVFRVARAIRFLKSFQIIVVTLIAAGPTILAILMIMSMVLYIFAIIGRDLYGTRDPARYGNLALAGASLFQLLTLDDWFEMYTDVANLYSGFQHILLFLITFIIIESLIFVSLFVAVIVDNLARARNALNLLAKDDQENMNQGQLAEKKESSGPILMNASGDWNEHHLAVLNSLKVQLQRERLHSRTLEQLVDMVDLSKLDQNV